MKYFTYIPLLLLSSCATIMHGSNESVEISSIPNQAEVWVDNKYVGLSPTIVQLTRKDKHLVVIKLEGYEPYEVTLTRQLSGWAFGNILLSGGALIGVAVDAISGGLYKLSQEQVQAQLRKNDMTRTSTSNETFIGIVMNPDPSWEKIGSLTAIN